MFNQVTITITVHVVGHGARNTSNMMPPQGGMVSEKIHTRVHIDTFTANIMEWASETLLYTTHITEVRND